MIPYTITIKQPGDPNFNFSISGQTKNLIRVARQSAKRLIKNIAETPNTGYYEKMKNFEITVSIPMPNGKLCHIIGETNGKNLIREARKTAARAYKHFGEVTKIVGQSWEGTRLNPHLYA